MRLKGKVAIITGAGRGIGRATALRFAEEGASVAVADIDAAVADDVAGDIEAGGGRAVSVQVDVADRDSVNTMVEQVRDAFGHIDVLINNAGILRDGQLYKLDPEDFDAVIQVNLTGVFNCTKAIVEVMREQGSGVILNASSVVGLYGNFGQTNYVASKSGVIGMTKVWARELGPKGIRVNAVAPGFIKTRMTEGVPDKVMDQLVGRIPLRTTGTPEDVANAYLWLASDEAKYVTGHVLSVDGGVVV